MHAQDVRFLFQKKLNKFKQLKHLNHITKGKGHACTRHEISVSEKFN